MHVNGATYRVCLRVNCDWLTWSWLAGVWYVRSELAKVWFSAIVLFYLGQVRFYREYVPKLNTDRYTLWNYDSACCVSTVQPCNSSEDRARTKDAGDCEWRHDDMTSSRRTCWSLRYVICSLPWWSQCLSAAAAAHWDTLVLEVYHLERRLGTAARSLLSDALLGTRSQTSLPIATTTATPAAVWRHHSQRLHSTHSVSMNIISFSCLRNN